ncbi:SDR family NAD(P)-dependent oxidoreductase [Oceanomicrobium pacificus]|uniref:Glucose 1-dehydrogenase n=1 Tax=Oceanomicrobium pacificus TaxID=2692916 RepID=A0A6B0TQR8_9RHOB|nr:SDR family NAD(P)-dependent oxidoreductase [Oceanomicrobium pacificus]MXU65029.1 glucose 1-dehydrogenase [Oceanomicrobium pacificus]
MNSYDLKGQRAIVTGGGRGMGLGIADLFLKSGASVSLWDISADTLADAAATLDAGDRVDTQVVDVSDLASVEAATAAVRDRFGGIDILVNAAGIAGGNMPLDSYDVDLWNKTQAINVNGTFHTCRAVVPVMKEGDYGRIVNVSSMAGKDGNPNASAYSVSKAAVIALTKSLGKELATTGIRANVITPAVIETPMVAAVTPEQLEYMLAKIPMGRMGTVAEIANLTAWLCSRDCSYSTGAVFDISGGRATY